MVRAAETDDATIRAAVERGDLKLAAEQVLERYGKEICSFLVARLRHVEDGQDAFGMFAEDLLRGLDGFEFRCAVRVWAYALARNAANRLATDKERRPIRNPCLSQNASVLALAATLRRSTALYLRTGSKRPMRALREQLTTEDETILMLHVDRGLTFRELAVVLHGTDIEEIAQARETVRLRKRFARIKHELRRLAVEEGLLPE